MLLLKLLLLKLITHSQQQQCKQKERTETVIAKMVIQHNCWRKNNSFICYLIHISLMGLYKVFNKIVKNI